MEKEFASIFEDNKDISLNEYDINKLIERTIEINENEFPVISVGNSDKESPKIHGTITSKEYEESSVNTSCLLYTSDAADDTAVV